MSSWRKPKPMPELPTSCPDCGYEKCVASHGRVWCANKDCGALWLDYRAPAVAVSRLSRSYESLLTRDDRRWLRAIKIRP